MTKITYIPGEIANAAIDEHGNRKPVTRTQHIFDDAKGKSQADVNADIDDKFTQVDNEIEALEKQDVIPVDTLPAVATADPKKIYRVVGEDSYTDHMVNASGDGWKTLATYSFPGIDDEPTAGSNSLVKSGGVFPTFNAVNKALIPITGKVSIIGDSISTFAGTMPSGYATYYPNSSLGVTSLYDMWWNLILSLSGSKLEVNASWSGSRVTNGAGEGIPDFYDRTNILGTPDYIFVALGTNDSTNGIILGNYDYDSSVSELSESQFIPAYIKGVKSLLENYPNAKIVLFVFQMAEPYAYAIKSIGKYYNLQVIDVRSYYRNNVHPNKTDMTLVAQDIVYFYVKGNVDSKPAYESENLISSGGVFAKTSVIGDIEYLGALPEYDGAIRDSGFVYTTLSKHKVFKVNPGDKVIMKAGERTFYFVLKDYSYKGYNYTPNYATGYSGRKTLFENTTSAEMTMPSDAHCIAILVFETNDRTPKSIFVNGYDICKTLDGHALENQNGIKTNKEDIQTTQGNVDTINTFLDSKEMTFVSLISAYYNSDFRRNYKVYLDSIYNEQYFDEVVSFKEDNTEIRHDSTMIIKDGIIYDVYTYDPTGSGDNASHDTCKVVLTKYNLSTQQKTTYVVAEKTGVYDGITLDGGAGSPNCYLVGNIIHILFAAKATKFTIIHCEFDTTDDSLSNYSVINLTKNDVSGQLSNTLLNTIYHDLSAPTDANFANCQANSTIGFDGTYYYIGIVFGVDYGLRKWHGFVAKSSDFVNWTYVVDVNYSFNPSYEMPVIQKNGYLYIAQRPHYIGNGNENQVNYGVLCKYNINSNEIVDVVKIKNCSSKPAFFKDGNDNIYLVSNGENRTEADVIMVSENQLAVSKILFHYNNRRFNYPCVVLYNGSYYVSCSFDGVRVYTFPMTAHFNSDVVNQKMLDFMES